MIQVFKPTMATAIDEYPVNTPTSMARLAEVSSVSSAMNGPCSGGIIIYALSYQGDQGEEQEAHVMTTGTWEPLIPSVSARSCFRIGASLVCSKRYEYSFGERQSLFSELGKAPSALHRERGDC